MIQPDSAENFLPLNNTDKNLRSAAAKCSACPLYILGKHTVFGRGPLHAPIMIIGEQPSYEEDKNGQPFTGPIGAEIDKAVKAAGLSHVGIYFTHVVKHTKWRTLGGKRISDAPNLHEVEACLPWLKAEIELHKPLILICLGERVASIILNREVNFNVDSGKFLRTHMGGLAYLTLPITSILEETNLRTQVSLFQHLVIDLHRVGQHLNQINISNATL